MEVVLHFADFIVMGIFVLVSLGIGVYYGVFHKQTTTEEYLVGNRKMHLIPVAMSLLVTYQSAISVMGVPIEIYFYNTMGVYIFIGIAFANLIQGLLITPLLHPLKLISAYEYLGRRFQSRSVQLLGTCMGMLQTLLYMAIVLYAPALALEAVANIPLWVSVIVVGLIGTVYTSVGGIKSVIWTDVFQFVCLFGGLASILIIGIIRIGGFQQLVTANLEGNRIDFGNASFDPRVRHTIWSTLIGELFIWLPNCCNQSAVQRICSMKTLKEAKTSTLLNVPLCLLYGFVLSLVGLLLYAYFHIEHCDPLGAGYIQNANQLVPYFVMHVFSDIPGLAGIFIAALFSAALSSLSSGINSMAANTLQDILVNCLESKTQARKTLIAKILVFVYGILTVALAYLAKGLDGPVTQMGQTAMGASGGPVVGIMFLGAAFPQANWIGALTGGVFAIAFNIWLALSCLLYGKKTQKLPLNPTSGCDLNSTVVLNSSLSIPRHTITKYTTLQTVTLNATVENIIGSSNSSYHIPLFDISYLYLGLLGFLMAFIIGLVVSLLTGKLYKNCTEPQYIFPCLRELWRFEYENDIDTKCTNVKMRKVEKSRIGSPKLTNIRRFREAQQLT